MTLRESWLDAGPTQANLHRKIVALFGVNAISESTLKSALRGEGAPEERTRSQINRAIAEIKREMKRQSKPT